MANDLIVELKFVEFLNNTNHGHSQPLRVGIALSHPIPFSRILFFVSFSSINSQGCPLRSSLLTQILTQLLSPCRGSLDRGANDTFEPLLLQDLQTSICSAIGAGDVLSKLGGGFGRLLKHLASAEAGLGGEAGGLFRREAEGCGAGDEVFDHGEEVCGAGACYSLITDCHPTRAHIRMGKREAYQKDR